MPDDATLQHRVGDGIHLSKRTGETRLTLGRFATSITYRKTTERLSDIALTVK